jgi:endonuclease YncB( thermonuclease family)
MIPPTFRATSTKPGSVRRLLLSLIGAAIMICAVPAGLIARDSAPARPIRTVEGTVTKVTDGDTIQVVTPEQTKIKVYISYMVYNPHL